MNHELSQMMMQVKKWIEDAGNQINAAMDDPLVVEEKTSRSDVVTNIDKQIEAFLVDKIQTFYPNDQIIGEEGTRKKSDISSRVWVIDPIDGTLNFVKKNEQFCIMLGIFENNQPKLGFIYNVRAKEFMYGGTETGVFLNDKPFHKKPSLSLSEGLLAVNTQMFLNNTHHAQEIALEAMGVRMNGCAGIEFLNVLQGKHNAYLSYLAPWDFGAGVALSEALGYVCKQLPNQPYELYAERQYFVVTTPQTYTNILRYFNKIA